MGAVPATRVSAASDERRAASGADATAAVPAAVSSPSVAQTTAPAAKKSKVPMMVGATAVVAIGVAATMYAIKKPNAATGADTTTHAVATNPVSTPTSPGNAKPQGEITPLSKQTASDKPVADQLRGLIDNSKNPARAADVQARLRDLQPKVKSSEEIYLLASLYANMAAARKDTAAACRELDNVMSKLAANEKDQADSRKIGLSCP
jgi:hypothetical protein